MHRVWTRILFFYLLLLFCIRNEAQQLFSLTKELYNRNNLSHMQYVRTPSCVHVYTLIAENRMFYTNPTKFKCVQITWNEKDELLWYFICFTLQHNTWPFRKVPNTFVAVKLTQNEPTQWIPFWYSSNKANRLKRIEDYIITHTPYFTLEIPISSSANSGQYVLLLSTFQSVYILLYILNN